MAKLVKALTNTKISNAKPKDRIQTLFDGGGLYLEIKPSGVKTWRMKCRIAGKPVQLTFGQYPTVSLAVARKHREKAKELIKAGLDPREEKKAAEIANKQETEYTFQNIAMQWYQDRLPEWKDTTARKTLSALERDVFPFIGSIPIADIMHQPVIDVLKAIEVRGALETAKEAKSHISRIFKFAIMRGIAKYNPVNDLDGVLRKSSIGHYKSITVDELPKFLSALDRNAIRMFLSTRIAINLMLLVFVRTSELIGAEWSEINLDAGVWVIPWQRMKMGSRKINPDTQDHRIDLPRQAVELLREQFIYSGNRQYVFPSQRDPKKPMSNGAILMALRRMGYQGRMTGHGFRALAASALGELGYRREVIERALSHKERDKVQAAYHRAGFIKERKKMLQHWADYLDSLRNHGKLVRFSAIAA